MLLDNDMTKILGLYWNASSDKLQYNVKEYDENVITQKKTNFSRNG